MKNLGSFPPETDCVLPPQIRILRLKQVQDVIGLKKSQIYALTDTPGFPQRIKLGTRAVGYLDHEVQAWIESRVRASRDTIGGVQ